MIEYDDGDESSQGAALEPTPGILAHFLEEQYAGDDRFHAIELREPGPLEGEALRVVFIFNDRTRFFVSALSDDLVIRVGLATEDKDLSESIESAALDSGDSLTEFLEVAMESEEELDHEVQHFHDDVYYFCSDIRYQRPEDLSSEALRDEVIYYLDGYMNAFYDYLDNEE